jgi:hypothetical protein
MGISAFGIVLPVRRRKSKTERDGRKRSDRTFRDHHKRTREEGRNSDCQCTVKTTSLRRLSRGLGTSRTNHV